MTQSGSPGDPLLSASIYRLVPTGKRDTVALEKPLPCSPGLGIHVILPRARVGRVAPNPLMPSGLMISSGSSTKMTLDVLHIGIHRYVVLGDVGVHDPAERVLVRDLGGRGLELWQC